MSFHKHPEVPRNMVRSWKWSEMSRSVAPSEDNTGSRRVTVVPRSCEDINKLQLDPKIVTLDNLIKAGETINPGDVQNLLNLSDRADIEEYNSQYVSAAYKYLKENKDKIFKEIKS